MSTTPTPQSKAGQAPIEDTDPGWQTMLSDWSRHYWRRVTHHDSTDDWPPEWLPPVAVGAGLLLVALLIYGLLVPLIRWLAGVITHAVDNGVGWLHHWNITHVVLDPVRAYLTAHATGLPISAATLWWTWCAAGTSFFTFALLWRAVAARIGWILFGAASVAMVWASTSGPARETTAGIAALWWTVLSLLALRRSWSQPKVTAHLPELPWLASMLQRRE